MQPGGPRSCWANAFLAQIVALGVMTYAGRADGPMEIPAAELQRPITVDLSRASPSAAWRALGEASGLPVVGFLPVLPDGVSIVATEEAIAGVLDRVADQLDIEWQFVGGTIVFAKPKVKLERPLPFPERADRAAAWFETLDGNQLAMLAKGRALPLADLSPEQAGGLAGVVERFQPGLSSPIDGSTPVVGVFFHPAIVLYDRADSETGRVHRLLRPAAPPVFEDFGRLRLPPSIFIKDSSGHFIPLEWPREELE